MSNDLARRDRLWQAVATEGLDALLVTHPINVTYLTGFSGEASYLVLSKGKTLLVSDGRFTEQIAEECPGLETVIRPPTQLMPEAAGAVLTQLGVRSVGCESAHLTLADFENIRGHANTVDWKPAADRVEQLRAVKDETEVAQIWAAGRIAERAFTMFRAMLRPEDREKDLVDAMEYYLRRAGAKTSAFPPIVAVGARAALPHAPPTDRPVGADPLLLVDWGANGPFYKSDLTRVLWSDNNSTTPGPSARAEAQGKLEQVFAAVLEAQRRGIAALRPGVTAAAVDAAARGYLADAGYGDYFTHGLGHGVGLQIHEAPFLRPSGTNVVLQAGMVVTVEPGVYLPGWGGVRIEDDVLIRPDGPEVLTSYPKDFAASRLEF